MLTLCLALAVLSAPVIDLSDYGLAADGQTDDGPALARAMADLRAAGRGATLRFPAARTLRIASAESTWVIELLGARQVIVDGRGCTLLLAPHLRLAHLRGCRGVRLSGLNVDYEPLPFADGLVMAADPAAGTIDVRVDDGFALPPLGGPTGVREQAYFAMLWHPDRHGLRHEHYFIADTTEPEPGSLVARRLVRVWRQPGGDFTSIKPGVTRISLPVRGIAHRMEGFGASPAVVVEENEDVLLADLNLWSAPLFGFNIARNRGLVRVERVAVEPRPGTSRLTSVWRDAFHVKANRAALVFEGCRAAGSNDDSFNIAAHSSRLTELRSPTELVVQQSYPLAFAPWEPGDSMGGYSVALGRRLGPVRVRTATLLAEPDAANPDRPVVPVRLELEEPLIGAAVGDVVWDRSAANPRTVLRRCTMTNACRLQSPVTLEECDVTALLWFYGDALEGPLPEDLTLRRCRLRQGRGNPTLAATFASLMTKPDGAPAAPSQAVLGPVLIEGCEIDGRLELNDCHDVRLLANHFVDPSAGIALRHCHGVTLRGNRLGAKPLRSVDQLEIAGGGPVSLNE